MISIIVRYLGPTNTKPARLKICRSDYKAGENWGDRHKPITISYDEYDYVLSNKDNPNHDLAASCRDRYEYAVALYLKQVGWNGKWSIGSLSGGDMVAVCVADHNTVNV